MRSCRECGCTDAEACDGGCFWVLPDVCSQCAIALLERAGLQAEWLELAQEEYRAQLAIAINVDNELVPRLWRPGDPI